MISKNNTNNKDNKSFDHRKENDNDIWSTAFLIDNIFNDLIGKVLEDKNNKKLNKYIYQSIIKFKDFRRKSPVTFFDIFKDDLANETRKQLNYYVKDCDSEIKIYHKLNGIITEVIALIYKQTESLILSSIEYEDTGWIEKTINEIRERIKNRWRFVKADVY
jgi:hypothetical protein